MLTFGLGNPKGGKKQQKNRIICLSNSESRLDGRPEFEINNTEVQKNCLVFMLKGSCKGHWQAKVQRWRREGRKCWGPDQGFQFLTSPGGPYTHMAKAPAHSGNFWKPLYSAPPSPLQRGLNMGLPSKGTPRGILPKPQSMY